MYEWYHPNIIVVVRSQAGVQMLDRFKLSRLLTSYVCGEPKAYGCKCCVQGRCICVWGWQIAKKTPQA